MTTNESVRQHYRLDLNLICTMRLRTMGTRSFATGERFDVQIINISGGGLCFCSPRDLPVSPLLAWQLVLEFDAERFNLLGQLVWKRSEENGDFQYGVKFIFVDEKDEHHLMNKLNRLQVLHNLRQKWQSQNASNA